MEAIRKIQKCQSLGELTDLWRSNVSEWKTLPPDKAFELIQVKDNKKKELAAIQDAESDGAPAEPQKRLISRLVDSKVLGRTVDMALDRDDPNAVIFDGVRYSMAEITKLKTLDWENLLVAHMVKREFKGTVK
jgi:hypothetical protein